MGIRSLEARPPNPDVSPYWHLQSIGRQLSVSGGAGRHSTLYLSPENSEQCHKSNRCKADSTKRWGPAGRLRGPTHSCRRISWQGNYIDLGFMSPDIISHCPQLGTFSITAARGPSLFVVLGLSPWRAAARGPYLFVVLGLGPQTTPRLGLVHVIEADMPRVMSWKYG